MHQAKSRKIFLEQYFSFNWTMESPSLLLPHFLYKYVFKDFL